VSLAKVNAIFIFVYLVKFEEPVFANVTANYQAAIGELAFHQGRMLLITDD
jgi:hypothetical protein